MAARKWEPKSGGGPAVRGGHFRGNRGGGEKVEVRPFKGPPLTLSRKDSKEILKQFGTRRESPSAQPSTEEIKLILPGLYCLKSQQT